MTKKVLIAAAIAVLLTLPGAARALELTSPAFSDGQTVPPQYTCDGRDVSPPLKWSNPPDGTASYALVMDDPDAPGGTWDHWVLYNVGADKTGLSEALPKTKHPGHGMAQGRNSWRKFGYGGPCPPSGRHRYIFKLYALDEKMDLKPGLDKGRLLRKIKGHVLDQAELMGYFR
jgi:hypothetical protein